MDSNHRVTYCNRSGIASVLPYDLLPVTPAGLEPGFTSVKSSCPELFGPKSHIGRRDGSRTRMDIYPTASETAPYTSFGTHRKIYNTFYIIHSTPNECQCQAFLKSYLKKRIITFEHLKLRFSGVALCQKHRKRPLVSWITRSKRP